MKLSTLFRAYEDAVAHKADCVEQRRDGQGFIIDSGDPLALMWQRRDRQAKMLRHRGLSGLRKLEGDPAWVEDRPPWEGRIMWRDPRRQRRRVLLREMERPEEPLSEEHELNMECDICGHQWDGRTVIDQCPACGLLFVGPMGQKDGGPERGVSALGFEENPRI